MKTVLALSALVVLVTSASVSSYLSQDDRVRLSVLFTSAVPFKDAVTAYWSLKGLSTLNSLPKDANVSHSTQKNTCFCLNSNYGPFFDNGQGKLYVMCM